jgi:hypothetical protein
MSDSIKATSIDLPESIPAERIVLRPFRPDDAPDGQRADRLVYSLIPRDRQR